MKVLDEEWVLAYSELAVILAEEYGDGPLETVTDDEGNEEYTEKSLERLEPYYEEAENILYRIGFTRKKLNKIYEKFSLTEEEYNKLRHGFLPQFVLHTDEYLAAALYFDGDDGVVLFQNPSEVFDELGFSITLIDCKYCDISMTEMLEIAHTLDDLKNTGDKDE